MDGNNQNFDYFLIKFNDFDQINIGGVTLTYFIKFSIKSISQLPPTSYNTSIIEPISMDSPPNDKLISGDFGIFSKLVCMRYHCTLHQTLYAWLMRGFGIGVVWNP